MATEMAKAIGRAVAKTAAEAVAVKEGIARMTPKEKAILLAGAVAKRILAEAKKREDFAGVEKKKVKTIEDLRYCGYCCQTDLDEVNRHRVLNGQKPLVAKKKGARDG